MKKCNEEHIEATDGHANNRDFDLEFEFSFAFRYKQLKHETPLCVYADELFDGGMIKPLKVYKDSNPLLSKEKVEKSSKTSFHQNDSRSSRVSKLSPNFRESFQQYSKETMDKSSLGSRSWGSSSSDWYKKWKLKDLSLFRSVSESHATKENHGRKRHETVGFGFGDRSNSRELKNGGERRMKQGVSAHERHYRKNRKAGEEMKRKTFLPYKKTLIMGCSDLNPGVYEFCKGHAVEIKC